MIAAALVPLFVVLTLLRQNVVLTLAVIVGLIHAYVATNSAAKFMIQDLWFTLDREVLLSIPMFIFAGQIMSRGSIAQRLVRVMTAATSRLPGGLGVATILALAMFSAISGSGIVTMMAIGGVMYPALLASGYGKHYALGVLASGGTLGVIIPPSILMILYGFSTDVSVTDMFRAGWGPGLLMTGVLALYTLVLYRNVPTSPFDVRELWGALKRGVSAMMMPTILLTGIYTGHFTVTEAAALSVFYALVVETVIHRELGWREIYRIGIETIKLLGSLLPLLAFANSFNVILDYEGVPQILLDWARRYIDSAVLLLIAVNVLLLVAGALMDEGSAILILSPLLAPLGAAYGFDPVHFGIIVIVNLQIGYVMPPVAINVLVASAVFRESFGTVCRAVVPFIALMLLVLVATIAFPQLSLYFVGR